MRPRLAVTLSGPPRTWRACRDSLYRYVSGFDCDVYIHTWDELGADEITDMEAAYTPKAMVIEPRPDFTPYRLEQARRFPYNPQPYVFDMAYGIQKAIGLVQGDYDWVARVRFDALFDGVLDPATLNPDAITTHTQSNSFNFSDIFAIGRPTQMRAYAGFYEWLCTSLDAYDRPRFVSEYALLLYLKQCGLSVAATLPDDLRLLRDSMVGRPFAHVRQDVRVLSDKCARDAAVIRAISDAPVSQHVEAYDAFSPVLAAFSAWREALEPDLQTALATGPWATRAILLENACLALCPGIECAPTAEHLRTLRVIITHALLDMDLAVPLDIGGVVLLALSFDAHDRAAAVPWVRAHTDLVMHAVAEPATTSHPVLARMVQVLIATHAEGVRAGQITPQDPHPVVAYLAA